MRYDGDMVLLTLDIDICNLFVIYCLYFVILDEKINDKATQFRLYPEGMDFNFKLSVFPEITYAFILSISIFYFVT